MDLSNHNWSYSVHCYGQPYFISFNSIPYNFNRLNFGSRKQWNKTSSAKLLKAIQDNLEYIKNQTLAKELNIVDSIAEDFSFGDEINGELI